MSEPKRDALVAALRSLIVELRRDRYVEGVLVRWAGFDSCRFGTAERLERIIDEATRST